LYGDVAPKTASNFERLCAGDGGVSYKGSSVFRILKDFQISAGDIGSKKRGAAGKSSFGEPFARENFRVQHSMEGLVSMINDPKGQNDSRWVSGF
jgi:peptidyl-prolyl cis-trans isomerase B (cyclophilin B)